MKYTLDNIRKLLDDHDIILIGEFKTSNEKCDYRCKKCGHEFSALLKFKIKQIKDGRILCPKCSKAKTVELYTKKDDVTGLSKADLVARKSADTMKRIDKNTGLSIYQQNAKLIERTVNDTSKGESIAQRRGKKTRNTKMRINDKSGLTGYQETALLSARTQSYNFYEMYKQKYNQKFEILSSFDDYMDTKRVDYKCKKCGTIGQSYQKYIRCIECNPYNKSIGEQEVFDYCKSLANNVESNNRQFINPHELDIYLPEHKLAIEYDGIFWHSSDCLENENLDYHLNKTNLCRDNEVQLLHIFENEWLDLVKQNIWKSIIQNQLGKSDRIYARKCEIKPVDNVTKSTFLQENHLQGNCVSSINIGLYHDKELVSLMAFSKSRFDKQYDWELLRFCNKKNLSVVGGASRLLKRFRDDHIGSIISYADMRRSSGNLYQQLGFELSHVSKPNYWYFKDGSYQLESRIKYQKHKLKDVLEEFDDSLTESENMYNNGYRKIYDCGNQVWICK